MHDLPLNDMTMIDMTTHLPAPGRWRPVLPATSLTPSAGVVLGFLQGEELALWRAPDGSAQAWENRCPHRGLRFTLGTVVDGRVACGYHGWSFRAGDGRCMAIPAHPQMTVPRSICARTFHAVEAEGMVWVSRAPVACAPPATGVRTWVRTLGIRASPASVAQTLAGAGWRAAAPDVLAGGEIGGDAAVLLLTQAADGLVLLHAGLVDAPDPACLPQIHAALRRLRGELEAQADLAITGTEGAKQ